MWQQKWQQKWQQCDGTKRNDMELNSGKRPHYFGIVVWYGTVWNAAPVFCQP